MSSPNKCPIRLSMSQETAPACCVCTVAPPSTPRVTRILFYYFFPLLELLLVVEGVNIILLRRTKIMKVLNWIYVLDFMLVCFVVSI